MKRIVWLTLLLAASVPAFASSFDGAVEEVVIGPSATQPGYARVGVRVAAHSSPCGNPLWFAYEYSNTDIVGKTWTAAFMAAKQSGQTVHINGTGSCDQYSVEFLWSMHLL